MKLRSIVAILIACVVQSFVPMCLCGQQSHAIKNYDVIVAGAGTGGTSAAIEAARLGARVALLEESDWIGGQMTAAGVGTMDEGLGPRSTPPSGFYAEYLERIRGFYSRHGKSIHTCYWTTDSRCFDPRIAREILNDIIDSVNSSASSHGHIDLYLEDRVVRVLSSGNTVTGVVTSQHQVFTSKVLIDATEYGDVLPLTPAGYRSGNGIGEDHSNACIQSFTWVAVIKKYPGGVPPALQMHHPPSGYEKWLPDFRRSMEPDGNPINRNLPVDFAIYVGYRGIPDLSNPIDYTALDHREITRTSMNWFDDMATTTAIYDRSRRQSILCQAKLKTLADLYYLQHAMGATLWSVADDEGYDTAYNRNHACKEIPTEFKQIEYNMPQIPYIRESNRLIGEYTLTGGDIRREAKWAISVKGFTDAIAVGDYPDDLHGCNSKPEFFESDLEHITDLPPEWRFGAFQVPLRALIPKTVDGLLAAEKNISQSRLANGATRLQPITMLTGQAAGALAALAVKKHEQPREVEPETVQITLLSEGDILAREKMPRLTIGTRLWQAAQFAVVHDWMAVDGDTGFRPDDILTRAQAARILVNVFHRQLGMHSTSTNTGGFDPAPLTLQQAYTDVPLYDPIFNVVAALHSAAAAPLCSVSPREFCPGYSLTINEFLHSLQILIAKNADVQPPDKKLLLAGIDRQADEAITRGDAAAILYNFGEWKWCPSLLGVSERADTEKKGL